MMTLIFVVITTIVAFLLFLILANRWHRPRYDSFKFKRHLSTPVSPSEISVVCWNIGYAALGSRADFVIDGGKTWRTLAKREIRKAAERIADDLRLLAPHVALIQEAARPSFFTRGINVLDIVSTALANYSYFFRPDVYTVFVPRPFKIQHGLVTYSQNYITSYLAHKLPEESFYYYKFSKKRYSTIVIRQQIENTDKEWVLMNIHLVTFDKDSVVRKQQLKAVFDFAAAEYAKGNYVIIGGDWNMRIDSTSFPHTSLEKDLFWIDDFPMQDLPEGWKLEIDTTIPTVRTLERPFLKGENYTAIIDGYAISPNVSAVEVKGINKDFAYTDHHPVWARFRADI